LGDGKNLKQVHGEFSHWFWMTAKKTLKTAYRSRYIAINLERCVCVWVERRFYGDKMRKDNGNI
jgi:hypothetical protein